MTNYIDLKLTMVNDGLTAPGYSNTVGYYDISIDSDGDLVKEDGFDTNLIMSMFCERRASGDEVPVVQYRRGWWGNTVNLDGHEDGSKLWLLDQVRLTTGTVNLSSQYCQEGLQWLIDDGILKDISVSSSPTYTGNSPGIALTITLTQLNNQVDNKYYSIWMNTGA